MADATTGADKNLKGQEEIGNPEENKSQDPGNEVERVEMTKEEYELALQKETDRKVTQALKTREAEFTKRLEKEKAEARKEAEELAKLSAEERAKVEAEKKQMQEQEERRLFEEEKKAFAREKLETEAVKQLAERKLPTTFAPYIFGETAEDTFERITRFEKEWEEALEVRMKEKLRGPIPKGNSGRKPYFTRDQVERMSRDETIANMEAIEESMKNW